jgi:hypothetical protein
MFKVNYRSEAGLYHPVQRGSKPGQAAPIGYKRFKTVAAAIRFAIEQLPSYLLGGVSLEVGDHRYDARQVRELYDANAYPLKRHHPRSNFPTDAFRGWFGGDAFVPSGAPTNRDPNSG